MKRKWKEISMSSDNKTKHIVAAAPEMLRFLKLMCEHSDHIADERLQTIIDGALKTIAKAEGNES